MASNVQSRTRTGVQACLVCSAIFLLAGLCFGQTPAPLSKARPAAKADWTEFLTPDMARWNTNETVLGVKNVKGLGLKWSHKLYKNHHQEVSSPAIVDRVVYIGSSASYKFFALNATTGRQKWAYTTSYDVYSSPAVADGMVYFGAEANLYALNASTGALLWSYPGGIWMNGSPTVVDGVVYLGSDSDGEDVFALDASTGALIWSYSTGGGVNGAPAVVNGVVYVGYGAICMLPGHFRRPACTNYGVSALNASTGALLWNYTAAGPVTAAPAVANGIVYVGAWGYMHALDAGTGAELWAYSTGCEGDACDESLSAAVANGVVYFGGESDGDVHAVNASTGADIWTFPTNHPDVWASPVVANGVVYIGDNWQTQGAKVYALNAATGAVLWSHPLALTNSPAVANGMLYVGSAGYIRAFGLKK